jgi:hypothetical protein
MNTDEAHVLVLCCNECAKEIFVKKEPKRCPRCGKKFLHGWNALFSDGKNP